MLAGVGEEAPQAFMRNLSGAYYRNIQMKQFLLPYHGTGLPLWTQNIIQHESNCILHPDGDWLPLSCVSPRSCNRIRSLGQAAEISREKKNPFPLSFVVLHL